MNISIRSSILRIGAYVLGSSGKTLEPSAEEVCDNCHDRYLKCFPFSCISYQCHSYVLAIKRRFVELVSNIATYTGIGINHLRLDSTSDSSINRR